MILDNLQSLHYFLPELTLIIGLILVVLCDISLIALSQCSQSFADIGHNRSRLWAGIEILSSHGRYVVSGDAGPGQFFAVF